MLSRFKAIIYILFLAVLSSCGSSTYKQIDYFQDSNTTVPFNMKESTGLVIQPKDVLSIIVSSNDPVLAKDFNLTMKAFQAGSPSDELTNNTERLLTYFVSNEGEIDFPIAGKIKLAGLTKREAENHIKDILVSNGYLVDAHVTVDFFDFKISVIGEVNRPGFYNLPNDKITVLQGLSMAGDMTIYGRRDNVKVIREMNGERMIYSLDLTSTDVFESPGYYLQQSDVIYVCPNNVKAGKSTINENYLRSGGFFLSLASLAVVVTNFIIHVTRK